MYLWTQNLVPAIDTADIPTTVGKTADTAKGMLKACIRSEISLDGGSLAGAGRLRQTMHDFVNVHDWS